ncbi:zinc transporter ZntB [Rhodobacteraceae bacterium 2CG4]|uniref:Zinc transporter ZntB n=1 Tax=Halovulum marinum TaxID=2662447 RepID=A0A6L5Z5X5_9RHOB|nr:CorA family divalent cation transporter [Halovulum marinum]MSU91978.1 zinc transporter ZntB [Halovulum marinum]
MPEFIHFAYALSGADRGRVLRESHEIAAALEAPEPAWVHMRSDHPGTRDWIEANLGYLPQPVREALLAPETRPRALRYGDGVMVILRGVNTNPGAEPEDMVSIRIWVAEGQVVSLGKRQLASLRALSEEVAAGTGPERSGALLCRFMELLNQRIGSYLTDLDDEGDGLEERVLLGPEAALRARLTDMRGELVDLRRFLIPQREAASVLTRERIAVFRDEDRMRLAEVQDQLMRAVEEVESLRDRMVVVKDELASAISDRLNRAAPRGPARWSPASIACRRCRGLAAGRDTRP